MDSLFHMRSDHLCVLLTGNGNFHLHIFASSVLAENSAHLDNCLQAIRQDYLGLLTSDKQPAPSLPVVVITLREVLQRILETQFTKHKVKDLPIKFLPAKSVVARMPILRYGHLPVTHNDERNIESSASEVEHQPLSTPIRRCKAIGHCRGDRFLQHRIVAQPCQSRGLTGTRTCRVFKLGR